jgi:RNA polymerase sigma-70 factor (sigma-E family)
MMDEVGVPVAATVEVGLTVDWFPAFYLEQRAGMVRLAFVLVDDVDTAEDLVQGAFARVYQRRSKIDDPLKYMRSAVYNACRNHHRALRVRRARPLRPESGDAPVGDHIIDVVRRLPLRKRAVVVLRFYAGLSDAEIAEAIGIPVGTVKSTLHRTLLELREELS